MLNKRLRWYLDSNNILCKQQSGFRKNCSTTDCLVTLESNICDAFANNQHLIAACLDMEKAYDLIWRRRIIEILIKHQITGNTLFFIHKFLKNRYIKVRINNGYSDSVNIKNGVPQGSCISVTLFLLAINDLQEHIQAPVNTTIFADDVTIFVTGKNIKTSEKLLQQTLDKLVTYTKTSGFKFSQSKSQAIVFSKSNKKQQVLELKLNNEKIEVVKQIKILGLILDDKLSWNPHIDYLKNQCIKRINILKSLSARNWGSSQKILTNTYKAIVQSKLDYGCTVYSSANEKSLKKLDTIINTSMRIAIGGFRTSPVVSVLSESDTPPLNLRREKLSINCAIRLYKNPKNQAHHLLNKNINTYQCAKANVKLPFYYRINKLLDKYEINLNDIYVKKESTNPPWKLEDKNINEIYKYDANSIFNDKVILHPEYLHVMTTCLHIDNSTGAAASLSQEESILIKLPPSLDLKLVLEILITKIIHETNHSKNIMIHIDNHSLFFSLREPKQNNNSKTLKINDILQKH